MKDKEIIHTPIATYGDRFADLQELADQLLGLFYRFVNQHIDYARDLYHQRGIGYIVYVFDHKEEFVNFINEIINENTITHGRFYVDDISEYVHGATKEYLESYDPETQCVINVVIKAASDPDLYARFPYLLSRK